MVCAFAALSVRGWGGYLCIAMFPPSAASGGRRPLRPQGAASAGSASRAELVEGENWCGRHALKRCSRDVYPTGCRGRAPEVIITHNK